VAPIADAMKKAITNAAIVTIVLKNLLFTTFVMVKLL